jgi:hypothetical protein
LGNGTTDYEGRRASPVRAFTAHPHDNGYDILTGDSVRSTRVGHVYWDESDPHNESLVLGLRGYRRDDDEAELIPNEPMDSADEVLTVLAEHGLLLDDTSITQINELGPR